MPLRVSFSMMESMMTLIQKQMSLQFFWHYKAAGIQQMSLNQAYLLG